MSNEEAPKKGAVNPQEIARGQLLVQIDRWVQKKKRNPDLLLLHFEHPAEFFTLGNRDGKPKMWLEFAACLYLRPPDAELAKGRGLSQSKKLATFYSVLRLGSAASKKGAIVEATPEEREALKR